MIKAVSKRIYIGDEVVSAKDSPIVVTVVTDPGELAKAREQDEHFEKNWAWFTERAQEIYKTHRGKCLCVAGQELFVGDTPKEGLAKAIAAHPNDNGRFTRIIPLVKADRIYAHSRIVVPL